MARPPSSEPSGSKSNSDFFFFRPFFAAILLPGGPAAPAPPSSADDRVGLPDPPPGTGKPAAHHAALPSESARSAPEHRPLSDDSPARSETRRDSGDGSGGGRGATAAGVAGGGADFPLGAAFLFSGAAALLFFGTVAFSQKEERETVSRRWKGSLIKPPRSGV